MAGGAWVGRDDLTVVGRVSMPLTGSDDADDGSIMTLGYLEELCAQDLVASNDVNNNTLIRFRDDKMAPDTRNDWRAQRLYCLSRRAKSC
jgi:hypothetical protein